ncbi:MAG: G1 family glutamic endopeptidase [Acidimicrobiales bacterium]|nr:G1 family glutamic endopeptidase [Acidimicrobiales bacterium]
MSHRRVVLSLVAVLCAIAGVAFAPGADARAARPAAFSKLFAAKADDASLNWAGYYRLAKPGEKITEVSGTTYAPKLKLLPPTQAAAWVGIGGATTSDLIQAGVAFGRVDGYYAWFERLPEPIRPITSGCVGDNTCRVAQGDRIDVHIKHLGNDTWRIYVTNVNKWSWSMDTPYNSSFSSAEWILEAPIYSLNAAPFVPIFTTPANIAHARFFSNRYVVNGQARVLKQNEATRTHVSPVGVPRVSTASDVRGDSAFQVCPYKQNCPKP